MKGRVIAALGFGAAAVVSQAALVSTYDFNGNLNASFNAGHAESLLFYQGGTDPTSAGNPTYVSDTVGGTTKQVAQFGLTQGFQAIPGIGKNGGGLYGNVYSILWDVKLTQTTGGYASMYQTSDNNSNDGDMFWQDGAGFGINGVYGNSTPPFTLNEWHRVVMTVDETANAGAGAMDIYVDGNLANSVNLGDGVDGRFSIYTYDNTDGSGIKHLWLMMDNDGDNGAGYLSQAAFWDTALTAEQVKSLGPVGSAVPEPLSIIGLSLGAFVLARRRRRA